MDSELMPMSEAARSEISLFYVTATHVIDDSILRVMKDGALFVIRAISHLEF